MKKKSGNPDIRSLFEPKSITVIGASHKPGKIGYTIVDNILSGGFKGEVYPVNPAGGEILGVKTYKSVTEVGGDIDVAVIAVPEKLVFQATKECAEKSVRHLVVVTSGFSEVGKSAEEREFVSFALDHGMRVLGPNVFGIYSSSVKLNATFGPGDIRKGGVAIITQSGAIGIAMIGKTKSENIGISTIVSVGNKSDIDEADLLEYLIDDDRTKIILMYIEGVKNGEKLVGAFKKAARIKPIVVIKSGRSKRGAMAAASHTGSLAGADQIFDDIARQCGVIRAENIKEALNWCKYLSHTPVPKGENTVIVTNGGGIGVMAADACEKYGVNLYDDATNLKNKFSAVMPDFGSAKNPIDITGAASADDYSKALEVAAECDDIDSVICLGCETAVFNAEAFSGVVTKRYGEYKKAKPVVFSVFGGEEIENCVNRLAKEDIPIYSDVYEAVSSLGALYSFYRNKKYLSGSFEEVDIDIVAIKAIVKKAKSEGRHFLLSDESRQIMQAVGIRTPKSGVVKNPEEAIKLAGEIGYPVVLKIVSKDIIHKSDAGGVALNLENKDEVIDAYESIVHRCRTYKPGAKISGIEVSEMVGKGVETIVGARRDSSFGPVVMFGLGGIYVEVMKDVVFRAYPISPPEALKMVSDIKSYPLLLGVRGEDKKDIKPVADAIIKVGEVLGRCGEISDIEINPLVVYDEGDGVMAVDARILLSSV